MAMADDFLLSTISLEKLAELQQFAVHTSADVPGLISVRAGRARFNQSTHISGGVHNCTGLDETHISQIRNCRWNGHTFHASSCCIWMDVGSLKKSKCILKAFATDRL